MKCPNCGAEAFGNYCEYCGTKLGNNAEGGYQPFTYNYNYNYTNNYRQPFAANTGKYANPQQQQPPPQQQRPPQYQQQPQQQQYQPYNPFQQQHAGKTGPDYSRSEKSTLTCLLLCLLFGIFGIHRFYVGKIGTGLLYLFTFGFISVIGTGIDLILIACGVFKDGNGKTLKWQ